MADGHGHRRMGGRPRALTSGTRPGSDCLQIPGSTEGGSRASASGLLSLVSWGPGALLPKATEADLTLTDLFAFPHSSQLTPVSREKRTQKPSQPPWTAACSDRPGVLHLHIPVEQLPSAGPSSLVLLPSLPPASLLPALVPS